MKLLFFSINLFNAAKISDWLLVRSTLTKIALAWEILPPATCMPDHCFCEPVASGFIRQPMNTWSNLAFILVGGLIIRDALRSFASRKAGRENPNPMQAQWLYPAVYGSAAALIGFGSMFYHASMTFYGQVFDILSMYLLAIFMALYNLSRLQMLSRRSFFRLYLAANIVLGYLSIIWPESRRTIFVGILIVILMTEAVLYLSKRYQSNVRAMATAMASLLIGCGAWILDVTGILCLPNMWLQLHALWHVMMAAAIWFLYRYYCSEVPFPIKPENHQEILGVGI